MTLQLNRKLFIQTTTSMKKISVLLAIALFVWCGSTNPTNVKPNRIRKIVIDAGHGGKDPGCAGHKCQEKDVALKIAYSLGANIKLFMPDVVVVYTRTRDEFVALHERARKSNNEKGNLFVSIHANASTTPSMYGTETYIMGLASMDENMEVAKRENSSILQEVDYKKHYEGFDPNSATSHILLMNHQNAYHNSSLQLATKIENNFHYKLSRHSRGVKQANFVVLQKVAMPSILVEVGFLTNSTEESFLKSDKGQGYIAEELYKAIRDYKVEYEDR